VIVNIGMTELILVLLFWLLLVVLAYEIIKRAVYAAVRRALREEGAALVDKVLRELRRSGSR
jgi:hypothetical protein